LPVLLSAQKDSAGIRADIETIRNAILRTAKAINEKNADSIIVHYSKDIMVSYPGIPDTHYDEFYESYKQMLKPQPGIQVTTSPLIEEVIVSCDLAIVRMTWETTITESVPEKITLRKAKDLQVWKRESGSWKFIRGMWYHIKATDKS